MVVYYSVLAYPALRRGLLTVAQLRQLTAWQRKKIHTYIDSYSQSASTLDVAMANLVVVLFVQVLELSINT